MELFYSHYAKLNLLNPKSLLWR